MPSSPPTSNPLHQPQDSLVLHSPTPSPRPAPTPAARKQSSEARPLIWKTGSSNYLDSLRALPEVRSIPWLPGKELPPEKSTESPRIQTKGAFLLSTRGKINDPPCTHCATGVGRFRHCVSLEGWFHGACATCQMGTRGNLCSIRKKADKAKSENISTKSTSTTESQKDPAQQPQFISDQSTPQTDQDAASSTAKRKRESLSDNLQTNDDRTAKMSASYSSPYNVPYALPQAPGFQPAPYPGPYPTQFSSQGALPYYNYADPRSNLVNYIYKTPIVPPPPTGPSPAAPHPPMDPPRGGTLATPPFGEKMSWVRPGRVGSQPNIAESRKESEREEREDSGSLSPSEQLLDSAAGSIPAQNTCVENSNRRSSVKESTSISIPVHAINGDDQNGTSSLLDSLPKKKQRQIQGFVKNLQNSIHNARTHADSMEKQLQQLKEALGID